MSASTSPTVTPPRTPTPLIQVVMKPSTPPILAAKLEAESYLRTIVEKNWFVCLTSNEVQTLQQQYQLTINQLLDNPEVWRVHDAYRDYVNQGGPQSKKARESYTAMLNLIDQRHLDSSIQLQALIRLNGSDFNQELSTSDEMTATLKGYRKAMEDLETVRQYTASPTENS